MTSTMQLEANRANAGKSSGPKSEEGKARVACNAIKHGLLSKENLLPNEDPIALGELRQQVEQSLEPSNELEAILVERIVSILWRLKRAGRIEAAIFVIGQNAERVRVAEVELSKYKKFYFQDLYDSNGETATITDMEKYDIAKASLESVRAAADEELPSLSNGYLKNLDVIEKLQRYETNLERSLYKALHELQRMQAFRQGVTNPLPIAVDLTES